MGPDTRTQPRVVAFPGAPAAPSLLGSERRAALVAQRSPALQVICGAVLGIAGLMAAASVVVVRVMTMPPATSTRQALALAGGAVLLIVVASRLQARILGNAGRGVPAPPTVAAAEALAAAILDGYARGTVVGFSLLAAAACLGLVIAVVTGSVRYALVICLAAALGMVARWPRRAAIEALLRRRGL
jgi:hypothetical protein